MAVKEEQAADGEQASKAVESDALPAVLYIFSYRHEERQAAEPSSYLDYPIPFVEYRLIRCRFYKCKADEYETANV